MAEQNSQASREMLTIHTDGWKAYDGLNYRVFQHENEFACEKSHVNGIRVPAKVEAKNFCYAA